MRTYNQQFSVFLPFTCRQDKHYTHLGLAALNEVFHSFNGLPLYLHLTAVQFRSVYLQYQAELDYLRL